MSLLTLDHQGTVKELRKQLTALIDADARNGKNRLLASVGCVVCLAGSYFWRAWELDYAIPVRGSLAVLLLICTVIVVRASRANVDGAKIAQIQKLLSVLRSSVVGHGSLTVKANLVPAADDSTAVCQSDTQLNFVHLGVTDHSLRIQNWLTLTAPLGGAQVQLCCERATYRETTSGNRSSSVHAMEADKLILSFSSDDGDRVARLKAAIDATPHHEVRGNEIEDGVLCTILEENPREVPAHGEGVTSIAGTTLTYWAEWYVDRLTAAP